MLGNGKKIIKKRGRDYIYICANIKGKKRDLPKLRGGIYFYF